MYNFSSFLEQCLHKSNCWPVNTESVNWFFKCHCENEQGQIALGGLKQLQSASHTESQRHNQKVSLFYSIQINFAATFKLQLILNFLACMSQSELI